MGYPLTDITIYYHGTLIQDAPKDWTFRKEVNFIADFYHNRLENYKPPKTSRICIIISKDNLQLEPSYLGSICNFSGVIDEQAYLSFSKNEKYKYLLDLIHRATCDLSERLDWDSEPFKQSYQYILDHNFIFKIEGATKKSQDRKKTASSIVIKDEHQSHLIAKIESKGSIIERELVIKKNWWWYDKVYEIAKKCKWITKNQFGYLSKDKKQFSFYDLEEDCVKCNLQFRKK